MVRRKRNVALASKHSRRAAKKRRTNRAQPDFIPRVGRLPPPRRGMKKRPDLIAYICEFARMLVLRPRAPEHDMEPDQHVENAIAHLVESLGQGAALPELPGAAVADIDMGAISTDDDSDSSDQDYDFDADGIRDGDSSSSSSDCPDDSEGEQTTASLRPRPTAVIAATPEERHPLSPVRSRLFTEARCEYQRCNRRQLRVRKKAK